MADEENKTEEQAKQLKDVIDKTPGWLKNVQNKSWEPELLISGKTKQPTDYPVNPTTYTLCSILDSKSNIIDQNLTYEKDIIFNCFSCHAILLLQGRISNSKNQSDTTAGENGQGYAHHQ